MINPYKENPVRKNREIVFAPIDKNSPKAENGEVAFIDLDGDGKYSADRDSAVLFDFDGDGRYDKQDLKKTAQLVKLMRDPSQTDLDGDGVTSEQEQREVAELITHMERLDRNRDGVLEGDELKEIKLGNDYNGDGYFSPNAMGSKLLDMTGKSMTFSELELKDEFKKRIKSNHSWLEPNRGFFGPLPWNIVGGS